VVYAGVPGGPARHAAHAGAIGHEDVLPFGLEHGEAAPSDVLCLRFQGVAVSAHRRAVGYVVGASVAEGNGVVHLVGRAEHVVALAAPPLLPRCHYFLFGFSERPCRRHYFNKQA